MIIRIAIAVLCLCSTTSPAVCGGSTELPTFVKSDTGCLRLQSESGNYSKETLVKAQYRWLAENYPGYRFKQHAKPKPQYLKKLGCETKRGSILTVTTEDGEEVTVCYCLPANASSKPVPATEAV